MFIKTEFNIQIPNRTTRKALKQSEQGKGLTACKDVDELYQKLGI